MDRFIRKKLLEEKSLIPFVIINSVIFISVQFSLSKRISSEVFFLELKITNFAKILLSSTRLLGIEVLLPVNWENEKFFIKGDSMVDKNNSNPRTMFIERRLSYRLQLDNSTHGNAFMIGYSPEDSEKIYKQDIVGNGSGQADILMRFDTPYPDRLYYFCPDESGAGGPILIKDSDSVDKPNQRTDILLTFSYGQPEKAYQILVREVLSTPWGEIFCERPQWLGEVPLPRGLNFSR